MDGHAHVQAGVTKAETESDAVARLQVSASRSSDAMEVARRGLQVAIGVSILLVESVATSIAQTIARQVEEAVEPADEEEEEPAPAQLLPLIAGAALGVAFETVRTGARLTSNFGRSFGSLVSFAPGARTVQGSLERARSRAAGFDARWRDERAEDQRIGSQFLASIVPPALDAALDRIDLTDLVLSRIDLNRIVNTIDVEGIVRRVDLAGIARDVIDELDLASIARGVIDQLDLASIARGVIDEVDLPGIVRESTGTMADETVEGFRAQTANADLAVSRFVDRLLGRHGGRDGQEPTG